MESKTCDKCNALFNFELERGLVTAVPAIHHKTLPALRASANSGCPLCNIVHHLSVYNLSLGTQSHAPEFQSRPSGPLNDIEYHVTNAIQTVAAEPSCVMFRGWFLIEYLRGGDSCAPWRMIPYEDAIAPSAKAVTIIMTEDEPVSEEFIQYHEEYTKRDDDAVQGPVPVLPTYHESVSNTFTRWDQAYRAMSYDPAREAVMNPFTGNEAVMQKLAGWCKLCHTGHAECRQSSDDQDFLPTRLLDLNSSIAGTNTEPQVILTLKGEIPPGSRFMTLSHTWGGDIPSRLTQASLRRHLDGVLDSQLALTFQHAVRVTRALGVRYLWIDALCIIQDSEADWRAEAPMMSSIYRNSFLNIMATNGTSSNSGFFSNRYIADLTPQVIALKARLSDQGPGGRSEQKNLPLRFLRDPFTFAMEAEESKMSLRGWILQERFMARRTVYFAADRVYWECAAYCANDLDLLPHLPPTDYEVWWWDPSSLKHKFDRLFNRPSSFAKTVDASPPSPGGRPQLSSKMDAVLVWCSLVTRYMGCKLTFGRDKLVAMSGLAKLFRDHLQDEYVAGLWRSCLPYLLLWEIGHWSNADRDKSAASYRAPSWSWAAWDVDSAEDQFTFVMHRMHAFLDLYEARSPDSSVRDLTKIREVSLSFADPSEQCGMIESGFLDINVPFFQLHAERSALVSLITTRHANNPEWSDVFTNIAGMDLAVNTHVDPESVPGPIYMLVFYQDGEGVYGLVVVSHADERGAWRRVGTFHRLCEGKVVARLKKDTFRIL